MAELPGLAIRLHSGMDSRACADLARAAERAGFASVWFAENQYERGVLPAATACALATERLRIGIGIFHPYNRHPSLMAMEIGTLDELSQGRAVLGIGAGVPQMVGKIVPHDKPLSAVRDAAEIARALLSGKEAVYSGEMFSADHVRLGFKLARERVPVYLAAMADASLKLCGELGDGLIVGNMCPPAYTGRAIRLMREGAEKVGRVPPADIVKYVPASVRADAREARAAVKPAIGAMLGAYWKAYESSPGVRSAIGDDNGIEPERFASALRRLAAGEPGAAVLDDSFVGAYSVAGTLDECLEQCRMLRGAGVTELALSFVSQDPAAAIAILGKAIGVASHA